MQLCASQVKTLPSVAVLFGPAFANNAIAGVITFPSGLILGYFGWDRARG